MKIALLDCETSSLDPQTGEILEIACIVFDDETLEVYEQYTTKVLPTHIETAHPKALLVNGYSEAEWKKDGAVPLETMMRCLSNGTKDCIVMAFNSPFDVGFLQQATRTTGIELYFKRFPICLRSLAWHQLDHRSPFCGWSMKEVCIMLGVPPESSVHRALGGVTAEFGIYQALKRKSALLDKPI